ncbi:MAG TPA: hypothetical protein VNI60_07850 [Pyrinomonadaceae bacterium]|nr:hypothetical protein [Pyrinomonadaceae bacterium]
MCGKVFIKRVLPFFLTFAVGLFIASFFVSIAAPRFGFNRGWRKHQQYHRMMESENQRLKEENARLKAESQAKVGSFQFSFEMDKDGNVKRIEKMEATFDADSLNDLVPPPPPIPPAPYRR